MPILNINIKAKMAKTHILSDIWPILQKMTPVLVLSTKMTPVLELSTNIGEVAQWLGLRIANRKVSSSSPALSTVLRVRDISNLSSHTVHSAECTGNCA